jgi:hypothetical protein
VITTFHEINVIETYYQFEVIKFQARCSINNSLITFEIYDLVTMHMKVKGDF